MLRQASSPKRAQKHPNNALQQLAALIISPQMSLPALLTDAQRGAEAQPVSQEVDGPERGRSSEGAQHRCWAGEEEGWVSASSCCCSSCPDGPGVPPLLGMAPARCQLCFGGGGTLCKTSLLLRCKIVVQTQLKAALGGSRGSVAFTDRGVMFYGEQHVQRVPRNK